MSKTVSIECNELVLTNNTENEDIVIKTSPGKTLSTDRHFCDIIYRESSGPEQIIPSSGGIGWVSPAVNLWIHGKTSTHASNFYNFNEIEPDADGVTIIKRSGIYSINSTIYHRISGGIFDPGYFGIGVILKFPTFANRSIVGTQVVANTQRVQNVIFLSTSFTGYLVAGTEVRIGTSQTTGKDCYLASGSAGVFNLNITEQLV